MAFPAQEILPI